MGFRSLVARNATPSPTHATMNPSGRVGAAANKKQPPQPTAEVLKVCREPGCHRIVADQVDKCQPHQPLALKIAEVERRLEQFERHHEANQ